MADSRGKSTETQKQIRATAIKHALNIEEKKKLVNRVSDLILQAYDIPTDASADPAQPSQSDATLFADCLSLFRPEDLDELVSERNIDGRCGYALCPNPHRKIPGAGVKTWNRRGGKAFKLLNTADLEKWCSDLCGDRSAFVRAQLSPEPAWMRDSENKVRLLDDMLKEEFVEDLASAVKALAIDEGTDAEISSRLEELSRERGEAEVKDVSEQVPIVEKEETTTATMPPQRGVDASIEGYRPKGVRFAEAGS